MNFPLAYSVDETCKVAAVGKTALYAAIRKGELRAVKRGRRTVILADDLRTWLTSLPEIPGSEPAKNACKTGKQS